MTTSTGRCHQIDKGALADSGVLIKVDYSTINYKDALAVTATAPIIRKYPLVPGIDLAGIIEEDDPDWQVGDRVVVNGWGMGEGHSGGLAQYARAGELSGETAAKYQHTSCNGHWNSRLHRFALCRCARGTRGHA